MKRKLYSLPDDMTKGAGVLPIASDTGRILLSQRGSGQSEPGSWSCWGGYSLIGETPAQNAVREFYEESSYKGNITLFLCSENKVILNNFRFITYVGVIPNEFTPEIDEETMSYKWLTMSELYGGKINFMSSFEETLIPAKKILNTVITAFGILNEYKNY